jgi:hypothetical protein
VRTSTRILAVAFLLLVISAHRLPAPIQEIPESPKPAPEQSAKRKSKPPLKPKESGFDADRTQSAKPAVEKLDSPPSAEALSAGHRLGHLAPRQPELSNLRWSSTRPELLSRKRHPTSAPLSTRASGTAKRENGTAAPPISIAGVLLQIPTEKRRWRSLPDPTLQTL